MLSRRKHTEFLQTGFVSRNGFTHKNENDEMRWLKMGISLLAAASVLQ